MTKGSAQKKDVINKRWVHSYEEDTDKGMVFRPATYNLPRSRGRRSFELKQDGTLVEIGIGPTDRPQEGQGTWKLANDTLTFNIKSKPVRTMRIAHVDKDRLVIKK